MTTHKTFNKEDFLISVPSAPVPADCPEQQKPPSGNPCRNSFRTQAQKSFYTQTRWKRTHTSDSEPAVKLVTLSVLFLVAGWQTTGANPRGSSRSDVILISNSRDDCTLRCVLNLLAEQKQKSLTDAY
jgi:hypothetical protein